MGKRNLNDPNIADIFRRLKRLETNTMLASASVGRGRLRFYDGSVLLIENGALNVTGTATIAGTLEVTGTTNLVGTTNISGPLNVTGTTSISGQLDVTGPTNLDGVTTINGDTTITGQLDVTGPTNLDGLLTITGDTTVDGNFEILGNGLFKAGETTIEPTGKATFGDFVIDPNSNRLIQSPAGWLFSTGPDNIGLASSLSSSVNLNSDFAELNYIGESVVRAGPGAIGLTADRTSVSGNLVVEGTTEGKKEANWRAESYFHGAVKFNNQYFYLAALPTTTVAANLYVNPTNGRLYRSTA